MTAAFVDEATEATAEAASAKRKQILDGARRVFFGSGFDAASMGEIARDLAYRLYNICERKGWAQEALAYNGLVIAWPEISKLAQVAPARAGVGEQLTFG